MLKKLFKTNYAFVGLFMLDVSFYYHNFFQIGYLNNLSLLFLVIITFILTYIEEKNTPSKLLYLLLGIITGVSWYFYIGKLFIFIVVSYLVIKFHKNHKLYHYFLFFLLPALFFIAISIINTPSNTSGFGLTKTILHKEYNDTWQLIWNIFDPWLLAFYTSHQTHYLPISSYTDIITAVFYGCGVIFCFISFFIKKLRDISVLRILLFFSLLSFFIGFTSPYGYSPTTRGIHYVPFYILFAVYFLSLCMEYIHISFLRKTLLISIVTIIFSMNLYAIYQPLPLNISEDVLSRLQLFNNKKFLLINDCDINFYNIVTMSNAYMIPDDVAVADTSNQIICNNIDYILTCSAISVCNGSTVSTIDNQINVVLVQKTTQ
jgi:hypothetical protein